MIPDLEVECVEEARARAVSLPSGWSVSHLVDKLREAMLDVNPAVLKMAARLRDSGAYPPYHHSSIYANIAHHRIITGYKLASVSIYGSNILAFAGLETSFLPIRVSNCCVGQSLDLRQRGHRRSGAPPLTAGGPF